MSAGAGNTATFWDRNLWPIGLTVLLGCFVVFQLWLVRMSALGFEGPDQMNYYKMGLEYSKEKKRQQAQRQLGWELHSNLPAQLAPTSEFPLTVAARDRNGRPLSGQLAVSLRQPATQSRDRRVVLETFGPGQYRAGLPLSAGVWDVTMEFEASSFRWNQTRRVVVTQP